ncbi:MAG: flagellin, partial [Lachnospiraceae bacterium]|nr:flagellin [Lachnospiraceae bacterium]
DRNGFEIEMEVTKKTCGTKWEDDGIGTDGRRKYAKDKTVDVQKAAIVADVTDFGMMTVHVGANENQIIDMDIPEVSTKSLGIEHLNLCSGYGADKALTKLDAALIQVSKVRSRLGAYQNRLESTVNSLNANDEDLTSSVSRIRDVDMAQETTEYTQYTILVQAATSVLAQANELPQQALQLIQ